MFSVIVSTKQQHVLESVFLPSLEVTKKYLFDNDLPPLQLILVEGTESLCKNYNKGIDQCTHTTRFFIHEDVDLNDGRGNPIMIRCHRYLENTPGVDLIGLVGTNETPAGFWWNCSRESIVGHVMNGTEYWKWNIDNPINEVRLIDGMFMATRSNMRFSEDIEGFHCYDSDYCMKIVQAGGKIVVIPHMVKHMASKKDLTNVSLDYYNKKWKL